MNLLCIAFDNACRFGDLDIIKDLISIGVDIYSNNNNNGLMTACRYGRLNVVKYLVSRGVNISDTALLVACSFGKLNVVKYLINNYGIDIGHSSDSTIMAA